MAKVKRIVFELFCSVAGSALCSISVNMFSAPNDITQGGLTGVAVLLEEFYPGLPIGTAIFLMNIPLFILAKFFLEKGFLFKTFVNTLIFTLVIDLGGFFIKPYYGDKLLSCAFCGLLSGAGLALVLLNGGTTGGTDIIAMLLKKVFKRISVGKVFLFLDLCILGASFAVYGEVEAVLYASVAMFISSRVIDTLLYGTGHGKVLFIVTEKGDLIKEKLYSTLKRGVTTVPAFGGYTGESKELLFCATRAGEIKNISRIILSCDKNAFTVICDAGEIAGSGFDNSLN